MLGRLRQEQEQEQELAMAIWTLFWIVAVLLLSCQVVRVVRLVLTSLVRRRGWWLRRLTGVWVECRPQPVAFALRILS